VWYLLSTTFSGWSEDKAPRLGAALAYYTVFSLTPLLMIAIAVAGFIFGAEAARGQIVGQIQALVGEEGGKAIQTMIENAAREKNTGIAATLIGVATLLFGASGVFGELQDSLNTVWGVKPRPGRGVLGMIKDRFASFTMVMGIAFLLLVSLILTAAISALGAMLGGAVAEGPLHVLNALVSFAIVTGLFAAMYRYVPDAKIEWRDVWIGAAVTSLLFTVGKVAIGLYLGRGSVASAYGAAGSLVVLLVWVYWSAQILFFGAEFTKVYARSYGSGLRPELDAVPVSPESRAEQGLRPVPVVLSAVREAAEVAGPVPAPATSLGSLALAAGAGVVGFVLGRTRLARLVKAAPEALPAAMKVTAAVTAVDRYLAERERRRRAA
jgi:membrane protein